MEILEKHGRWYDTYTNNSWDTLEDLKKYSKTLKKCSNCYNCSYCSNCYNCYNCYNCLYCSNCSHCSNCLYCSNCSESYIDTSITFCGYSVFKDGINEAIEDAKKLHIITKEILGD